MKVVLALLTALPLTLAGQCAQRDGSFTGAACGYNCDDNCNCDRCNTKPGCMSEDTCLGPCNSGGNAKWCPNSSPAPVPGPTPALLPTPVPTPGSYCPAGYEACAAECPTDDEVLHKACIGSCARRCPDAPTPTPAPMPPAPTPGQHSYAKWARKNCYNGHGGQELDGYWPSLTAEQCTGKCDVVEACECATYEPSNAACWLRASCVPEKFADDDAYTTYVKDGAPAPTPPPPPAGSSCCYSISSCAEADTDHCHYAEQDPWCVASQAHCEINCRGDFCPGATLV